MMTQREIQELDVYENEKGFTAIYYYGKWAGTFGFNNKRNEVVIYNEFRNFKPDKFLGTVYQYFRIDQERFNRVYAKI